MREDYRAFIIIVMINEVITNVIMNVIRIVRVVIGIIPPHGVGDFGESH